MKKVVMGITCLAFLTTGCSANNDEHHQANSSQNQKNDSHQHHEKPSFFQGDIREETASVEELPTFLTNKPDDMKVIYSAAAKHEELLSQIPCYCGCGTSAGHKNSYDCFVHENKNDGSLVWDDHGTKCGVCLEIAATAVMDYSEGKSVKEIRDKIDDAYKEGYAEPTPTPMPKGS
ncbi:hypothetical protein FIU87_11590 [Bacillus sp. THAF10]|uniref:PCYCGC domain-containing protein n=1 Tax=Bacillus sp. THAF10 TaxID=2587848 RepID=UPI0012AA5C60|nr:PCYCGC domain-containing protein [Bacillus sp. THAF10]QFT89293.1 hypothetical protein FIU87_11590 [Bacillus sp. THAF10]